MNWGWISRKKKETQMAKNIELNYTNVGDGVKPGTPGWGATVRLPMELRLEPNKAAVMKTGIKFNRPVLIFAHGVINEGRISGVLDLRVSDIVGDNLLKPDTEVVFWLNNRSDKEIVLAEKDAVFYVVPLPDVEVSRAR